MKLNFNSKTQIIHTDFNNDNILFQGNKLIGIIDFNDIEFAPVIKDLALTSKNINYPSGQINSKKITFHVKEYRKHAPFSKKEERLIIPLLIGENCTLIRWFYWDMKKHLNERHKVIDETIKQTKMLARGIGWR